MNRQMSTLRKFSRTSRLFRSALNLLLPAPGSYFSDTETNESSIDLSGGQSSPYARRLAHRFDNALQQREWEEAKRLSHLAAEFFPGDDRLVMLRARTNLMTGNAEAALENLDLVQDRNNSFRLLKIMCLLHSGKQAAAHVELHSWARSNSCPLDVRRLLAYLEWESGREDLARAALTRNIDQIEDPASIRLSIMLALHDCNYREAGKLARRLRIYGDAAAPGGDMDDWLASLGLLDAAMDSEPEHFSVDSLAVELISREEYLPSVVAALLIEPDIQWGKLLLKAMERALPDLQDHAAAVTCLAQLSYSLGMTEEARRWIIRGLQLDPLSAELAKLLVRLQKESDSEAVNEEDPKPLEIVVRISERHPDWPDMRILRSELQSAAAA